MKSLYTIAFTLLTSLGYSQMTVIETFEDFNLELDTFLNGSDGSGGFSTSFGFLPNDYNEEFSSWTGWSISSMRDITTEGFQNQYSAITGGGFDGSETYAVSYHFIPNTVETAIGIYGTVNHKGLYVTNATYPYLSMLNGDGFAKKFGGADGNDPDFFSLTIKGVTPEGEVDSTVVYLADYRFEDNSLDYIVDEWIWVDLPKTVGGQGYTFTLNSSDVGAFGVNTPTYFCIDNIIKEVPTATNDITSTFDIFPNPAVDQVTIDSEKAADLTITTLAGQVLVSQKVKAGKSTIDIDELPSGMLLLSISNDEGVGVKKLIKG